MENSLLYWHNSKAGNLLLQLSAEGFLFTLLKTKSHERKGNGLCLMGIRVHNGFTSWRKSCKLQRVRHSIYVLFYRCCVRILHVDMQRYIQELVCFALQQRWKLTLH